MAHRFHIPSLPGSGRVKLPPEVARHLDVLDLGAGSEVVLFDGSGREAKATIVGVAKGAAEAEVMSVSTESREASVAVTLATAVPKGRRMDTLVRMCAELGVRRIVPLVAKRSVVRIPLGDERSGKLGRWRKIARAASEQSGRNVLAEVSPAADLKTLLAGAAAHDLVVVLHPSEASPPLGALLGSRPSAKSILLILGPEGGFTGDELALAESVGIPRARLTRSVLRIETACVAAVSAAVMTMDKKD